MRILLWVCLLCVVLSVCGKDLPKTDTGKIDWCVPCCYFWGWVGVVQCCETPPTRHVCFIDESRSKVSDAEMDNMDEELNEEPVSAVYTTPTGVTYNRDGVVRFVTCAEGFFKECMSQP
jgi:hypothetical protein